MKNPLIGISTAWANSNATKDKDLNALKAKREELRRGIFATVVSHHPTMGGKKLDKPAEKPADKGGNRGNGKKGGAK